eukprot:jgi/Chrzof1/13362/Cz07g30070.t1
MSSSVHYSQNSYVVTTHMHTTPCSTPHLAAATASEQPRLPATSSNVPIVPAASTATIFVVMPSYRDPECSNTVIDMFAKADNPRRIYVGATEARVNANESCLPESFNYPSHIKLVHLPITLQEGHTYSRYLCSKLYQGQDYLLQIDAHTKFIPKWDTILVEMLQRCPSKKPLITHYPFDFNQYLVGHPLMPVMCTGRFNERGMFKFDTKVLPIHQVGLRAVPFVAGGFIFTLGRLFADVPYDPNLPFFWEGEEFLYSVRMWTNGYDFFTPDNNAVFHQYAKGLNRPKVWTEKQAEGWHARMLSSENKYRYILGLKAVPVDYALGQDLVDYGLGKQRSLKQYLKFAGLDLVNRTMTSEQLFCSEALPKPLPAHNNSSKAPAAAAAPMAATKQVASSGKTATER